MNHSKLWLQKTAGVRLRVLDLFAGLGGWSRPFKDRGHEVVTLDINPRFGADFTKDILSVKSLKELEAGGNFDVVLASPPCQAFSLLSGWRHWRKSARGYSPKTEKARTDLALVRHTFRLIKQYRPPLFVIENPRGFMQFVAPRRPQFTVWYCQLGENRAKPTDLWTNLPVRFPDACRYQNAACHHQKVPRGVRAGTLAIKTPAERALIPYGLGLTVALGAEFALAAQLGRMALQGPIDESHRNRTIKKTRKEVR